MELHLKCLKTAQDSHMATLDLETMKAIHLLSEIIGQIVTLVQK